MVGDEACGEIRRSGHVLLVGIVSYFMLAFVHTHLAAFVMLDAVNDLGISITSYTLATGTGNLIKCAVIAGAGPLMDCFGAHNVANATLMAGTCLVMLLAVASSSTSFMLIMATLIAITGFAEQPTFVIISATHLQALLSLMTTSVTSAFSASGAVLPLILSSTLQEEGWRATCWYVAGICAAVVPAALCLIRPGPLAVGRRTADDHAGHADEQRHGVRDGEPPATRAEGKLPPQAVEGLKGAGAAAPDGTSAAEALRDPAFWSMTGSLYLHMVYGATLTNHLPTVLRTDASLGVLDAAKVASLQFSFAIGSKLLTGALIALPRPPRALLFTAAPLLYTASHFLLLDVRFDRLSAGDLGHALTVTRSLPRLRAFAVAAGFSFGVVFGLIQCLPIRLFGRRDLPTLQSLMYVSVLLATATAVPLVGFLRDAFDQTYSVPFMLTLSASVCETGLLQFLMRKDINAAAAREQQAAAGMHVLV